jgi:hypothetical protein
MRTVYKGLAYAIAVEVALQATLIALAVFGLGKWVTDGNVFDKAVMESQQSPFPEVIGFALHGINGGMVIPGLALLLMIFSFFAKVRGGIKWAGLVLLLVVIQVNLGYIAHDIPVLGGLHGLNALLLFSAAVHTGRRTRRPALSPSPEARDRVETPA